MLTSAIVFGSLLIKSMSGTVLINQSHNFEYPNFIFVDPKFDSIGTDRINVMTGTDRDSPQKESYEPNDSFRDATSLTSVHAYNGSYRTAAMDPTLIPASGKEKDIDFYTFNVLSDCQFDFWLNFKGSTSFLSKGGGADVTLYKHEVTEINDYEETVYSTPKEFYSKTFKSTANNHETMYLKAGKYFAKIEALGDSSLYSMNERYDFIVSAAYLQRPSFNIKYLNYFQDAGAAFWEADYFPYMTYNASFYSYYEQFPYFFDHYPDTADKYDFMPYEAWIANGKEPVLTSYYAIWDDTLREKTGIFLDDLSLKLEAKKNMFDAKTSAISLVETSTNVLSLVISFIGGAVSTIASFAVDGMSSLFSMIGNSFLSQASDKIDEVIDYLQKYSAFVKTGGKNYDSKNENSKKIVNDEVIFIPLFYRSVDSNDYSKDERLVADYSVTIEKFNEIGEDPFLNGFDLNPQPRGAVSRGTIYFYTGEKWTNFAQNKHPRDEAIKEITLDANMTSINALDEYEFVWFRFVALFDGYYTFYSTNPNLAVEAFEAFCYQPEDSPFAPPSGNVIQEDTVVMPSRGKTGATFYLKAGKEACIRCHGKNWERTVDSSSVELITVSSLQATQKGHI